MEWTDTHMTNGIADGIMLDSAGNVIECTSANIFARYGDTLMTPSLLQCGVAGITRQRIIDLAYTLSLKVKVEVIDFPTLLSADEVIICNSLYSAWQVKTIQEKTIKTGTMAANIRAALNP